MIDLLHPQNRLITVSFPPAMREKLCVFWQKHSLILEEWSGIQRHYMIPMLGSPTMNFKQWMAVKAALLVFAKSQPRYRLWIIELVHEIDKATL